MAVKPLDIKINIKPEGVDNLISKMNDLKLSTNLDENMKIQIDKVITRLTTMKQKMIQQIALGKLKPSQLGFTEIENLVYNLMGKIANSVGATYDPAALKPFRDEVKKAHEDEVKNLDRIMEIETEIENRRAAVKKSTQATGLRYKDPEAVKSKVDEWKTKLNTSLTKTGRTKAETGEEKDLQTKIDRYQLYLDEVNKVEAALQTLIAEQSKAQGDKELLASKVKEAETKLVQEKNKLTELAVNEIDEIKLLNAVLDKNGEIRTEVYKTLTESQKAQINAKQAEKKEREEIDKTNKSLVTKIAKYFSFSFMLQQVKNVINITIKSLTDLDKVMTETAIVTELNKKQAWELLGSYQDLAKKTGLATSEVSNIVVEFLKQGKNLKDSMELAEVAAKSARVAGISAKEAVDYLTSAVNGFGLAASEAEGIADRFAAISAASATDFEELAIAMSKVAPSAKSAGVGVDFMMGVLAKGLETTREAPENIGTAFKTIFARMREVTDLGKATEDGMSLNRVEKALDSVDVKLRDSAGQFRNLEDVLIDVGDKWGTLTSIEQAYLATALAGTRQQPRLLAIFNDFARTKELIQISSEATGQLAFQHMEYMDGMEAANAKIKTSWEGVITSLTNSEPIITVFNAISEALNLLNKYIKSISEGNIYSIITALTILAFILALNKKVILGFGTSITNTVSPMFKFIGGLFGMNGAAGVSTVTFGSLAASIWAVLWPILAVVAVAALLVGIFYLIVEASKTSEEKIQEFSDAIQRANKEINELETSKEKVQDLVDKFTELSGIVNKSIEDIKEFKNIADELGAVEFNDKTYQIVYTDFAGQKQINEIELERYNNDVNEAINEATKEAKENYKKALSIGAIEAFKNPIIQDTAKKYGYDFGKNYIESMAESIGLNEEQIIDATKKLVEELSSIDTTTFIKKGYVIDGKVYDTYEEAMANQPDIEEYGYGDGRAYGVNGKIYTSYYDAYQATIPQFEDYFDEDGFNKFIEKNTNIQMNYIKGISLGITKIEESNIEDIQEIRKMSLQNTLDNYEDGLKTINKSYDDPVEKQIALELFAASDTDAALLEHLVNDKKININVIASYSILGTDLTELELLEENISSQVSSATAASSRNSAIASSSLSRISPIRGPISDFTPDSAQANFDLNQASSEIINKFGTEGSFDAVREYLTNTLLISPDSTEGKSILNSLYNSLNLDDTSKIGTKLTDTKKTISNLFSLDQDILEGNFENLADLAAEYGAESIRKYLAGDTEVFNEVLETEKQTQLENMDRSIQGILDLVDGDESKLSDELKNQLETLRLMRDYYDDIVGMELQREAVLSNIEKIMKKSVDMGKISSNLRDMGNTESADVFEQMRKSEVANTFDLYEAQIENEKENLMNYGTFDEKSGIFTPNPDNMVEAKNAYDGYLGLLQEYTSAVSAEYEKMKSEIEDRYKAEADAIKNANDERWKEIEYKDSLLELENKITEARRKAIGQSLDNTMNGDFTAISEELQKLQQERQKLIEQKMVEQATKELEDKMNQEIIDITKSNTVATNALTLAIQSLNSSLIAKPITTNYNNDTWIYGTGVG